jgi:MerR family copper efflux transcriptional regulator
MPNMTIGQLARVVGVNAQTIRFYERQRILPAPWRRASGYRQYSPEAVERVRFVLAAKEVGFTLDEISELLALRERRGASCAVARERAEARLASIDSRLSELRRMRRALARMISSCSGRRAVRDCAILGGIEAGECHA